MTKKIQFYATALSILLLSACDKDKNNFDASGSFEAIETIISAETSGKILRFAVAEGQDLKAGDIVGYIDTTRLHLQKLQLEQNKIAILSGRPQTQVQTQALKKQLATAKTDRDRIANLVKGGVANQKQLDDAEARIATLEAQISAQESSLNITTTSINEQGNSVDTQLKEVLDQLAKSQIVNPISGTVLSKFAEPFEMTAPGQPLYKIADLSSMTLRAYITGDQFAQVKLDQQVSVFTDDGSGGFTEKAGTITWISDKAEFTPKTIQTKNERANLVYAIKVQVPNDGTLKIGMYGEINF